MRVFMMAFFVVLLITPRLSFADEKTDAKRAAIYFVSKMLKSPSTAQFEPIKSIAAGKTKDEAGNLAWTVVGYVDSQNSFAAMIRQDFSATVQHADGGWVALDVHFFAD